MQNALEVMWISCFWFLMPMGSVTSRSGRSPGGAKGPSGRNEPAREPHTTRPGNVRTASAPVAREQSGRSGDGLASAAAPPEDRHSSPATAATPDDF